MSDLISKDNMERQISEMWDAINNIPACHPTRLEAVDIANKTEVDLREMYRKQEALRDAAPAMLEICKTMIEYDNRCREKSEPLFPELIRKKITNIIKIAES
jgi:hypothetical protein